MSSNPQAVWPSWWLSSVVQWGTYIVTVSVIITCVITSLKVVLLAFSCKVWYTNCYHVLIVSCSQVDPAQSRRAAACVGSSSGCYPTLGMQHLLCGLILVYNVSVKLKFSLVHIKLCFAYSPMKTHPIVICIWEYLMCCGTIHKISSHFLS